MNNKIEKLVYLLGDVMALKELRLERDLYREVSNDIADNMELLGDLFKELFEPKITLNSSNIIMADPRILDVDQDENCPNCNWKTDILVNGVCPHCFVHEHFIEDNKVLAKL